MGSIPMGCRVPIVLVLIGLTMGPAALHAQDDDRARVHFDAGRSYFEEGSYEQALEEFQRAFALSPRPGMHYNIGAAQERLGMLREAAASFERYLREAPNVEGPDVIERRIQNLRRRADARDAGQADPGPDEAEPSARPSGGSDGLVIGGAVALGVAGAALVTFAITGGLVLSEDARLREGCFASGTCTPSDVSTLETLALVSDIMWPTAAVAGVVGAVLIAIGATSSSSSSAQITPFVSPTALGLTLGGAL